MTDSNACAYQLGGEISKIIRLLFVNTGKYKLHLHLTSRNICNLHYQLQIEFLLANKLLLHSLTLHVFTETQQFSIFLNPNTYSKSRKESCVRSHHRNVSSSSSCYAAAAAVNVIIFIYYKPTRLKLFYRYFILMVHL